MLIIDPDSACDVCMESYVDGVRMPYAITCGHIFCQACLEWMQPQCPLCRAEFSSQDVRKLRVDTDEDASSTMAAPRLNKQVQHLLDDMANIANESATVDEIQGVIEKCNDYYNAQPSPGPHTPLGVSYLLLSTLLEAQRKLHLQTNQLSELATARDHVHDRLSRELKAAQARNQELEETRRTEKETALEAAENARMKYDKMSAHWGCKVQSMQQQYKSLQEELDQLRLATRTVLPGKRSCGETALAQQHAAAPAGGPSGVVAAKLDKVNLPTVQLEPYMVLIFDLIMVSIGSVLFVQALHACAVFFQLCAR